MREPTFRRSRRAKQQRLLRTALTIVVLVALAALTANVLGGDGGPGGDDEPSPERPRVAFDLTLIAETDAKRDVAKKTLDAEGDAIGTMLNDWYQKAFIEFPTEETATFDDVAAYFAPEAQEQFRQDVESFTIGGLRTQVESVKPERATARVTVFFEDRTKPRLAVASVVFSASATLQDDDALPVDIEQRATLHLKKIGRGWVVSYYSVNQDQEQKQPTPSPSPS